MYFGCSKGPSHRDDSFEHSKHMFWMRNEKNNFQLHSLIREPDLLSRYICAFIKVLIKDFPSMDLICTEIYLIDDHAISDQSCESGPSLSTPAKMGP